MFNYLVMGLGYFTLGFLISFAVNSAMIAMEEHRKEKGDNYVWQKEK